MNSKFITSSHVFKGSILTIGTHIMVLENLPRGYLFVHSSPCLQQQWFWKFFMERNSISALHSQITFSTLILQDCAVGLLFALLPVLGGTLGILQGVISVINKGKTSFTLSKNIQIY